MTATTTDRALALVAELDQYPEQRVEIIFELAAELGLIEARVDAMQVHADRVGGAVVDPAVRKDYLDDEVRRGHVVAWPPGRNAPCWCGSSVKYKKCCGRPGS